MSKFIIEITLTHDHFEGPTTAPSAPHWLSKSLPAPGDWRRL